jgi:predicted nuclease of predicted toxin-antitoxin system
VRAARGGVAPPLEFFIDRSLGGRVVAEALRQAGQIVHTHDVHFPSNAKDVEWLTVVGQRGWIVLTKDERIRYRAIEQRALMQSRVGAFILTARGLTGPEMAEIYVRALPRIRRLVAKSPRPFIASVSRSGAVTLIMSGTGALGHRPDIG